MIRMIKTNYIIVCFKSKKKKEGKTVQEPKLLHIYSPQF